MTRNLGPIALATAGAITLAAAGCLLADKNSDALRTAPGSVQQTVVQLAGANKIKEFGPETGGGKTLYDLEYTINGVTYAADIDPSGKILEREVDIDASQVPPEVLDAAKKAHPDGKMSETAIGTAGDKMFYGLDMKVGKDTHEMEISAGGTVISDSIEAPETDEAKPAAAGAGKGTDKED